MGEVHTDVGPWAGYEPSVWPCPAWLSAALRTQGVVGQIYLSGMLGLAGSDCTLESLRRDKRSTACPTTQGKPIACGCGIPQGRGVPLAAQEDQIPRSRNENWLVARDGSDVMQVARTKGPQKGSLLFSSLNSLTSLFSYEGYSNPSSFWPCPEFAPVSPQLPGTGACRSGSRTTHVVFLGLSGEEG